MARFTIFGATGFIGRHLLRHLRSAGHQATAARRFALPEPGGDLGHGINCIGKTANFRGDPFGTVQAQVSMLVEILTSYRFDSFLYVSSTRVYDGASSTREEAPLTVRPGLDHLYNLTKLTGEALTLSHDLSNFRVARLSNVIGPGEKPVNFLASVIEEARCAGRVLFRTAAESAKDYVGMDDAVAAIVKIALSGKHRLYNVASGRNTTNSEVAALVRKYLGAEIAFAPGAPTVRFPIIDISRIVDEFDFAPRPFAETFARALEPEAVEES